MTETAAHQLVWAGAWPEQSSVTDHRNFELDCVLDRKPVESNQNRCHMRRSCTLGPLVNELSRYCAQKKKNQIREKTGDRFLHRNFCTGRRLSAGLLLRRGLLFTCFYTKHIRPHEVGFRSEDDGRATFCLRMLFHCLQQSSAPPCWGANSQFSSGPPRARWDEVLHHTDKNADWGAATGEERRPSVACEVWISSGKVSMINPLLGSRCGAGFFAPRWAAVSPLCSQARWMDSDVPWCWIYLFHYSLRVLAFTLQFCVHAGGSGGGVFWSVFEAGFWPLHRIFMTHLFACMHGLKSGPNYFWGQQKHFFLHSSF